MTPKLYLPSAVTTILANPPPAGEAIHNWLFRTAKLLHKYKIPPDGIVKLLEQAVATTGRVRPPGEIADAVQNSAPGQLKPASGKPGSVKAAKPKAKPKWPEVNSSLRQQLIDQSDLGGLEGLKRLSPVQDLAAHKACWFLVQLFPGDPLICVGSNRYQSFTFPLSEHQEFPNAEEFVVPSPMRAARGNTKKGVRSHRTLENTGPRHYLVTEFDSGTIDEQAATIRHLMGYAPLAMVVFSGSKSLHAWWYFKDTNEKDVERFFNYAVTLGADPATWSAVQMCRMPQGLREKWKRQAVHYFNPGVITGGKEEA